MTVHHAQLSQTIRRFPDLMSPARCNARSVLFVPERVHWIGAHCSPRGHERCDEAGKSEDHQGGSRGDRIRNRQVERSPAEHSSR
jgi:hypothetical protein